MTIGTLDNRALAQPTTSFADEQQRLARAALKPPTASERQTQSACIEYLQLRGWFVFETSQRWAADPRMAGLPDVLAFRDGVTLLLEMKTKRGKLRPSQVEFAEQLKPHLFETLHYAVIRDVDELIALERGIGRCKYMEAK